MNMGASGTIKNIFDGVETALRAREVDSLLFTSDGAEDAMLQGALPHVLKTVNFGSRATEAFAKLREYQKKDLPCAWSTGTLGSTIGASLITLRAALRIGSSLTRDSGSQWDPVNIYMMHGGTNFGFLNGANFDTRLPVHHHKLRSGCPPQ